MKFLQQQGQPYKIERNNSIIGELDGLSNYEKSTHKAYIGFIPKSDICPGDWLINSVGERFYVHDTMTEFIEKQPNQLKTYYYSEAEYKKQFIQNNPVFNIQNAYGSVIGTQSNVTLNYNDTIRELKNTVNSSDSTDKEELDRIISLLEMIVNNQIPVSKGLFSKFSDVMERNSWITGSIASALLSWLTTQIH